MQQIDPQGMLAAQKEKANDKIVRFDIGKQALFVVAISPTP